MVEHNDRPGGRGGKSHADGGLSGQIFGDGRNLNRSDNDRGGGNRGNDTRPKPVEPGRLNQPRLDHVRPNSLNQQRDGHPEPGRLNQPRLDHVHPNPLNEPRESHPEPGRPNQPRLDHVHPNLLNQPRESHPEPGRLNQPRLDHVHPNLLNQLRESHPEPGRLNQPRLDLTPPRQFPQQREQQRPQPDRRQPGEQVRPQVRPNVPEVRPNSPELHPHAPEVRPQVQPRPTGYPDGYNPGPLNPGGFNPGNSFRPNNNFRPNAQNIIGQVVNDLINPNARYGPGYQPGFNPGYNPGYNPGINPGYNPRFQPGYDPGYRPGYNPRFQPGFPPRPTTVQGIVGEVVRDLIAPPCDNRPGFNPGYNPGYAPDYNPSIYQPGRIGPNGPLRNLLRQGIGDLRNNPRGLEGLINNLGSLSPDMRFNVDRERREVCLGMDFNRAYDMLKRQQGAPENPELRRVLAGLDSVQLNPDALALNWKSEQLIALDQQPNGPRDIRLLLGGDTNRTTLNIETSETALRLSNIQGLEAVDPSGRRMRIHGVDVDASNPQQPTGTITIDNPIPRPEQLPPGAVWPEQVGLPIPITTENQKQAVPRLISQLHSARTAAINGDLGQVLGSVNPEELSTLIEMLKPQPQPDQFVPEPPQPGILPEVPPPPLPGLNDVSPVPQPGYEPQSEIPQPPQPGLIEVPPVPQPEEEPQPELPLPPPPGVTEVKLNGPGVIDYFDVLPPARPAVLPKVTPQTVTPPVVPTETESVELPPPPPPSNETVSPAASTSPWDVPTPKTRLSFSPSTNLFRPNANLLKPITPQAETAPPRAVPGNAEPVTLKPDAASQSPNDVAPAVIPKQQAETAAKPLESKHPGAGRSSDILRESGIKITAAEKIGPDKLFSLVFADADQRGPLVTGFKGRIQDAQFRQDLDAVGKTLNRFDVDKPNKAITVGLDFGKVYDTFGEREKHKPETRQFLQGLQSVTVTPEQLRLNFDSPRKLGMDGDGLKKTDLWMGMENNQTTFDIQTTDKSLALKNIKGLQAEVPALGKRLNVYEVNIDASSGTPVATALVDNPFSKPPGVSDDLWQPTMAFPIELGKTADEQMQVAQRLPQTLHSLNAMRQGARNGSMAERIGKLTKEEIIDMLKFQ